MLRKILFTLFFCFAIYYVFLFDTIQQSLKMLFKLLPMLLLLLLALLTPYSTRYKWFIFIGLLFCMVGDYTLQWFIIGLTSFLIGHIFYILAFRSVHFAQTPKLAKVLLLTYGVFVACWIVGTLLTRGENLLAVAVCAYIAIILTMGWTAFRTGEPLAISGALLFIMSDSVLAINRFITALPFAHEMIMLTYYSAQLLLMFSIHRIQQKVVQ